MMTPAESWRPQTGDVLADRFVIHQLARMGGMGAVYRAVDRLTGAHVAVKVTGRRDKVELERFQQESRILAELPHPAIVRHIESGVTPAGDVFLVMEWLEGTDLADRLARGRFEVDDAVALMGRACQGLAVAHARGIIHRDIKPSNLFLVADDPAQLKLLDFGIARLRIGSQVMTRSGALLGTVGYMAPEQARGVHDLDARADVFALGCVLFECLAGRPVFCSEHDVAVLVKVLMEDAPSLRMIRPDIPLDVDDLVARMLAKDPAGRPANASAILGELEQLRTATSSSPPPRTRRSGETLTTDEKRFMSVMLVAPRGELPPRETLLTAELPLYLAPIRAMVQRFGGDLAALADGVLVATHVGRGSARDRAAQAAACALAVRAGIPARCAALASGLAETVGDLPAGPVIDRAADLLRRASRAHDCPIAIDAVTASLIDSRFVVRADFEYLTLQSERAEIESPRTLLGKPTPCVGREKELAVLDAVAAECFAQPVAHAVLVTGPPGIGKSRLRSEFVARVRAAGDVHVLLARADQMSAGSSLALARQLLQSATRVPEGIPAAEQHVALTAYLARFFQEPHLHRISEFLAEIVGTSLPGEPSPLLRAARNDARIMNEWMRRSFEEWLEAECSGARPVLLVLEDLHWGDLPSVSFLEKAFRRLPERPLMMLALARPEVHEALPRLRSATGMQEILLDGLTRRPAERLVRHVLGDDAPQETVARVLRLADGNAFYLEELIRCVAEGHGAELPETVLGMVQARLEGLEPEARRTLRAASVFGDVFWEGAVCSLLGGTMSPADLAEWLPVLVDRELLVPEPSERFPGETGYAFRHALLREAAYALLTAGDRATAHRLAAEWLARVGEKDPLIVAGHFESGGRPDSAAPWLLRAAEMAINGASTSVAVTIAKRGLDVAPPEARGLFLEVQQLALHLQGAWSESLATASEAMSALPPGSTAWFRSAGSRMVAAIYLGNPGAVLEVLQASASLPTPEPTGPFAMATYMLTASLLHAGARPMVLPFIARLEASGRTRTDQDPAFAGWLRTVRATACLFIHDDVAPAVASAHEALRFFDSAADFVGRAVAQMVCGISLVEAGSTESAKALLRELATTSDRMLVSTADFAKYYLARVEGLEGSTAGAEALLGAPPGLADGARGFLAEAHLRAGRLREAENEARRIEASTSVYARVTGLSVLARIALLQNAPGDALARLDQAIVIQDEGSIVPFWRSIVLLARVDALLKLGRPDDAHAGLRAARARVLRIASGFSDEGLRKSYLGIDANAETLSLAERLL